MSRGLRRAGAVLAVLYAVVAVGTHALTARRVRPLFDGFAPPPPYNWVNPPPELASTNVPPRPAERTIPLTDEGSQAINVSTEDAQAILTLPAGAVAPHPPDTEVRLRLAPHDARGLGPLPPDLRIAGNAYELTLVYLPSETPVAQLATSGTIALTGGVQGDTLLSSRDGRTWQATPARPFGATHGMTGPAPAPGYFLVTASPAVTTTTVAGPDGGGSGPAALVIGAVAVGAIAAVGLRLRGRRERRRRARTRQQRRRDTRRKRS